MRFRWRHLRAVLFWAGPFALPGLSFAYVYCFYDRLPERLPIRWSANGHAELWTSKNVQEVLFGPVAGLCVLTFAILAELLIFACIASGTAVDTVPEEVEVRLKRFRRLGWMNWLLGGAFGVLAVLPAIGPEDLQLPGWYLATALFAFAVVWIFITLKIRPR